MEWWQILLYVLSLLALVYIIAFFYSLESIITFRGKLKKRTIALSVLLSEKKDVLLSLHAMIENNGLNQDDAIRKSAAQVRWLKISKLKAKDIANVVFVLSDLQKRLVLFGNSHQLSDNMEFITFTDTLADLDANYRRTAAIFNSDVEGYEYWRKSPLFRFWFWIDGFRPMNRLP